MTSDSKTPSGAFAERVGVEMSRAERYRVFLSLTVLDLGPVRDHAGIGAAEALSDLTSRVQDAVRACDFVELLDERCLAVLLPETKRQDAEIVAHRLADLVTGRLSQSTGASIEKVVPVEIASYPDTAGAKTMAEFLEELAARSKN